MFPKLSIITATFNSISTISQTVESVMQQTYPNIEYIVVDGLSTDGTKQYLEKNSTFFSKLIIEKDSGIYHALNKGISAATGDIIGILHSDDFFVDQYVISKIAKALSDYRVDSVYSDLQYVNKNNSKIIRHWKAGEFSYKNLLNGWMPPHPTFFVKKKIIDTYGGYNTSLKISADYDFLLRLLYVNKISTFYLPEVLIKMRIGGKSNRNIRNIYLKSREDFFCLMNNKIRNPFKALLMKNISKLNQFIVR